MFLLLTEFNIIVDNVTFSSLVCKDVLPLQQVSMQLQKSCFAVIKPQVAFFRLICKADTTFFLFLIYVCTFKYSTSYKAISTHLVLTIHFTQEVMFFSWGSLFFLTYFDACRTNNLDLADGLVFNSLKSDHSKLICLSY